MQFVQHFVVPTDGFTAFLWSTFGRRYIMAVMDFGAFAGTFPVGAQHQPAI
jgi:hypothetical protein